MTEHDEYDLDMDKVNGGVKLPLSLVTGKGKDWLMVRSRWSDSARKALDESQRGMRKAFAAGKDTEAAEAILITQAALVSGWSFDKPCTPKTVREWLRKKPHVADAIDRVAADNAVFSPDSEPSSSNGPE